MFSPGYLLKLSSVSFHIKGQRKFTEVKFLRMLGIRLDVFKRFWPLEWEALLLSLRVRYKYPGMDYEYFEI